MIPILYEANETKFTTNGIGRLSDAISCTVTEERNGQYELEMEYPVSGIHYADLAEERLILAEPFDGGTSQPFRIYAISRPLDGIVTVNAQHISYALKQMVVSPFSASSAIEAMNAIQTHIVGDNPFTFWTDKETIAVMSQDVPIACRSLLGGTEGSVLDVFGGGEYEFDRFEVKLHNNRGADRGVTIRYGKNMTALTADTDWSGVYTSIMPYWKKEDQVVTGSLVKSGHEGDFPRQMCVAMDFSKDYQEAPSPEQLEADAATYLERNKPWETSANIDVSFTPLWQSEEYANIAPLERVRLCDLVTVIYPDLGVTVKSKVIRTEYDVLSERYAEIELGSSPRATLAEAVTKDSATAEDLMHSQSWLEDAIKHATDLIRGGLGGHVVINTNADGQPEEILIMDTDNIETAQKVWRWNMGGFGYSSTGYEGDYGTAITMDGEIVADWIKAGVLQAGLIKAGVLSDNKGRNYWNLDTGDMSIVATKFSLSNGDTIDDIAGRAAADAEKNAKGYTDDLNKSLTQEEVFNRLTNNKKAKAIILSNGELYINASYINTGIFSVSKSGGQVTFLANADTGEVKIVADSFSLSSGETLESTLKDANGYADNAASAAEKAANGYADNAASAAEKAANGYADSAASQAESNSKDYTDSLDKSLTQLEVFNRLTNNGAAKGIYMSGNDLYINGTFIKAHTVTATQLTTDNIVGTNGWINLANATFDFGNGKLKWDGTSLTVSGGGTFSGTLSGANGTFSGSLSGATGTFSGTLSANCIKGGTLNLGGSGNGNGTMYVTNSSGSNIAQITNQGATFYAGSGLIQMCDAGFKEGPLIVSSASAFYSDPSGYNRVIISTASIGIYSDSESRRINIWASGITIYRKWTGADSSRPSGINMYTTADAGFLHLYGSTSSLVVDGTLTVNGDKNRAVKTPDYNTRLQYCYEMSSPMFGDIGEGITDENGECLISLDDVFAETVAPQIEYQVFLQKEGPGDVWVESKDPAYFVVKGTPNLKFAWELKAKQRDYEFERLEKYEPRDESNPDEFDLMDQYLNEIKELISEREAYDEAA